MAQAPNELENAEIIRDRNRPDTGRDDVTARERAELEANTGGPPLETEHIKGQIEETRQQLGETIDAIQDRLSYSNISEQVSEHVNNAVETAKTAVYDATIGKAVYFMKNVSNEISDSRVLRSASNSPLPFILLGLGAGMLAYRSFSDKNPPSMSRRLNRVRSSDVSDQTRQNDQMTGRLSEKAGAIAEKVSNAADSAYSSVTETLGSVRSTAGEYANQAYDKAGQMRVKATDTYDQYLRERPLALGAVALALGAAVGMAIPATQYEGELMGDARDDLFQKAQDTASQLLDKTKNVVNETGRAIKDEANDIAG